MARVLAGLRAHLGELLPNLLLGVQCLSPEQVGVLESELVNWVSLDELRSWLQRQKDQENEGLE